MKLSVELLIASFFREHPEARSYQAFHDFEISGVRTLPEDRSGCGGEYLYVTDAAGIQPRCGTKSDDFLQNLHILCILRSAEWLPVAGVMQIATSLEIALVINILQETFFFFMAWKQELALAVLRNSDPQRLLDLAEPVLQTPVLIYDPALKVLACSHTLPEGFSDPIYTIAVEKGYLDEKTFRFLSGKDYFAETRQQKFLEMGPDEYQSHALCAATINVHGETVAYCVMLYDERIFRAYAAGAFRIFCAELAMLMETQNAATQRNRSAVDYFLMDLLENPNLSPAQIRERFALMDISIQGTYVVLTLRSPDLTAYHLQHLRRNLPLCQIFFYQQVIAILCPLSPRTGEQYRHYLENRFLPLLTDQPGKPSRLYVSRPFHQIELFAAAYGQAERTAKLSVPEDGVSLYYYEDWWVFDLFAENQAPERLYCYCEPFLLDLAQQDTTRAKLELKILHAYLYHDRKLTLIGEKLNMHRNNVIYHIEQLKNRYHIDLDDPQTRLNLRISLELLRFSHLL